MLEKLLKKINDFKFKEAREYLEKRAHLIDPIEVDQGGNTLMHICMHAIVTYFSQLSKKYTIELSDEKGEEVSRIAADFEELIDKMLKLNISFNTKNSDGKLPIEILFECDTRLDEKFYLAVTCLKKFDDKGIFLHSGRKYVPELTLFKGNKKIPNKWKERNDKDKIKMTLHQRLALWRKYVEVKKSEHLPNGSFNLVIANIGFLLTDKRTENKESLFI